MGARRIMQCFTVSMFALVLLAAFAHAQTSTCSAGDADLCYDPTPAGSGVITHRATLNGVTQETYKGTVKLVSENAYGALIGVLDAGNYTAKNGFYTEITSFYAGTSSRRPSIVVDFRAVVNQALWTLASQNGASITAAQFNAAIATAATALAYTGTVPSVVTVSLHTSSTSSNTHVIVGSVIGGVAFLVLVGVAIWYLPQSAPASPAADVGVLQPACDKVIDAPTAASYAVEERECC